uniref:Uncharacterized protein n=1 Tax=Arundo donax TaxID=35708 RepID=A0A0A9H4F7_ARUDO
MSLCGLGRYIVSASGLLISFTCRVTCIYLCNQSNILVRITVSTHTINQTPIFS